MSVAVVDNRHKQTFNAFLAEQTDFVYEDPLLAVDREHLFLIRDGYRSDLNLGLFERFASWVTGIYVHSAIVSGGNRLKGEIIITLYDMDLYDELCRLGDIYCKQNPGISIKISKENAPWRKRK